MIQFAVSSLQTPMQAACDDYVLLFGRTPSWWVYGLVALLAGQGVFSLAIKLRSRPPAGAKNEG